MPLFINNHHSDLKYFIVVLSLSTRQRTCKDFHCFESHTSEKAPGRDNPVSNDSTWLSNFLYAIFQLLIIIRYPEVRYLEAFGGTQGLQGLSSVS